ncbi:MAG: FG-GAP-like repeat-containing protein, partial [Thermodesulfobacteriota bacterium]|nr:FG-GAP-like repeat-containing protein [Thermodesulfobacteriota bacterium]
MKMKKHSLRYRLLIIFIFFMFPALTNGDNKVKVALLPFQINSLENLDYVKRGIRDMLASRISADRNVVVLEDELVNEILSQTLKEPTTEEEIKQIGIQLGAAFVISGSLTKIGQSVSIDAKMFDLRESKSVTSLFTTIKGMDNVIPEISNFALKASTRIAGKTKFDESASPSMITADTSVSDTKSEFRTPDEEKDRSVQPDISSDSSWSGGLSGTSTKFWKSQRFDFEIIGLDIGDVNGDGINETIVMEYNSISIYKYSGNRLVLIQKIQGSRADNYISLDVADINGNGIPEIFVSNLIERELQSFIIEFQNADFRKIKTGIKYFLRVNNTPKKGNILLGQKIGIDGIFHGGVHQFIWKNN